MFCTSKKIKKIIKPLQSSSILFNPNEVAFWRGYYNNKSIYNEQKTISIYPSKTYIEKGTPYDFYFTKELEDRKEDVLKQARREYDDVNDDDILYIESEVGAFSFSDLFPYQFEIKNKCDINILYMVHLDIKKDATW